MNASFVVSGHSEILISDVYEFWPANIQLLAMATIQIDCVPTNPGEEVVLKLERDRETPIFKDKSQSMYVNKRGQSAAQRSAADIQLVRYYIQLLTVWLSVLT